MDKYRKIQINNVTSELKLCTITPKHLSLNFNSSNIIMQNSDIRKNAKTPNKTPLRLSCSSKKKTPHNLTNDRYIPNRTGANMEASYHMLVNKNNQENINCEHLTDTIKRKLISDTCQGACNDKEKVLNLHQKPEIDQASVAATPFGENIKVLYTTQSSIKKSNLRHVQTSPDKILDAPGFRDDFYLNLIDWSSSNCLAVALNKELFIWNASTKEITQLFGLDGGNDSEESAEYISSASWIQKGNILAVGNSKNSVELWDVNKQCCLRQMKSHNSRVGALTWNSHILTSGSRSGDIHHHDVRVAQHHVGTIKFHTHEVCGLKWNPDGRHLATGANDNLVGIWDTAANMCTSETRPLHVLNEHKAAVKAIAWCSWQNNILATGGGTTDRQICIWNMYNGALLQSHDTHSQVSSLLWNKNYKELVSSHGFQENQLTLWKYPEMSRVCELTGHENRILSMAMSPDEETVVSVSSDETLRFWRCFGVDDKQKKSKEGLLEKRTSSQTGLSRCIR